MSEDVSIAEACALLNMTVEELRGLMCGPDNPDLAERLTIRHLLAAKIAMSLLPMANLATAVQTGITAGHGAKAGGGRLLVIAYPNGTPEGLSGAKPMLAFASPCPSSQCQPMNGLLD